MWNTETFLYSEIAMYNTIMVDFHVIIHLFYIREVEMYLRCLSEDIS